MNFDVTRVYTRRARCGGRAEEPGPRSVHRDPPRFRAELEPWPDGKCTGRHRRSGCQHRTDRSGLFEDGVWRITTRPADAAFPRDRARGAPDASRRIPAPEPGAVDVRPAYLYNPGLVTSWHYVTGVMSIIMFINASLVASALAVKEKETGTIEQLLMTPARRWRCCSPRSRPSSC